MTDVNWVQLGRDTSAAFQRHPIVAAVMAGRLNAAQYARYMTDVFHYATHSSVVIGQAGVRLVHSHPALAAYLFHHAGEELGHDAWAHQDLIDVGLTAGQIAASQPSPACRAMIDMEFQLAFHGNPVALFGWMFVLECLGGDMGGAMAAGIDAALGLAGKGTRFLAGHGEADGQHMQDLAAVIAANVTAPADVAAVLAVAERARDHYLGILDAALAAQPVALAA